LVLNRQDEQAAAGEDRPVRYLAKVELDQVWAARQFRIAEKILPDEALMTKEVALLVC